jgi:hypothetical protein
MWLIVQKNNPLWYFDATGGVQTKISIAVFITTSHSEDSIALNLLQIRKTFENQVNSNIHFS